MAITARPSPAQPQPYTVLRAICVDGERVEVGATVHLSAQQFTELAAAGKVGPHDPKAEARAAKAAKAKVPEASAPAPAPAPAEPSLLDPTTGS